jgi:hypothetical protein
MHVCEQNNSPLSFSLRGDSLGFRAEGNANLISGVHITPHLSCVVEDRQTSGLCMD